MNLADDQIIALLTPLIPKPSHNEAKIYLDTQLKKPGQSITMGRKEFQVPFAGYFIFIDLLPTANWGHPAKAVVIAEHGDDIFAID